MSGGRHVVAGRMAERADVLAYLKRRRANAEVIARRYPDSEPFAEDRRRQLDVIIADIEAEMHLGAAQVEADRAAAEVARA